MFDSLFKQLNESDNTIEGRIILESMSNGGAPEDDILDSIAISSDEDKKIMKLLDAIPGDGFKNDEELTDAELAQAVNDQPEPTLDELLDN